MSADAGFQQFETELSRLVESFGNRLAELKQPSYVEAQLRDDFLNPLFRALRLDKLIYQALEHTLRSILLERWECVPALAMLRQTPARIRTRAEATRSKTPWHLLILMCVAGAKPTSSSSARTICFARNGIPPATPIRHRWCLIPETSRIARVSRARSASKMMLARGLAWVPRMSSMCRNAQGRSSCQRHRNR